MFAMSTSDLSSGRCGVGSWNVITWLRASINHAEISVRSAVSCGNLPAASAEPTSGGAGQLIGLMRVSGCVVPMIVRRFHTRFQDTLTATAGSRWPVIQEGASETKEKQKVSTRFSPHRNCSYQKYQPMRSYRRCSQLISSTDSISLICRWLVRRFSSW